ncbi:MAG: hypothetical protein NT007_06080 [Candidatus Kapabacteria bacterium]|nr:hypothetical protein [Candidatus Kapabacteria bacterium]
MKQTLILFGLLIIIACQSNTNKIETHNIIDYIKWDQDYNGKYREFQYKADTTFIKLFAKQISTQINDSLWKFEFYWLNYDLLPVNRSVEKITKWNNYELTDYYLYESDSLKRTIEAKANILSKATYSISNPLPVEMQFKFKKDPALTMRYITNVNYKFQHIDSIGKNGSDCLIYQTKSQISLQYTDNRPSTTVFAETIYLYIKGKGLVQFEQSVSGSKVLYKLVE